MRVAIVTQSYYPRPGGVTEHVHHTAENLRLRGHSVTIITTHFGRDTADPDVMRIGRNVLVPMNGAWVNMTVGTGLHRRVRSALRSLRPDVVHVHCPLTPTLPLLALHAAPDCSRVVGTFHAAADGNLAYTLFRRPLAAAARRLDERIAVSDAALSLVSRYFPGKYSVVPNGVDRRRFSPLVQPFEHLRDGAFNVLYVGRMDKRKGVKYLFEAVSMLARRRRRRIRFIVVGEDGPRRHLMPRLPDGVELVLPGVVDRASLPRYFVSGDVFCSPAVGRESFGIVLLEAMAAGVPVVGTRIPGFLTILRDRRNALVVPPRNPEAMCAAIEEIMDDDRLRQALRSTALDFVRLFAWERIVDGIESVYCGGEKRAWEPRSEDQARFVGAAGAEKA